MEPLSNSFQLLEIDAEDDRVDTAAKVGESSEASGKKKTKKKEGNNSSETVVLESDKDNKQKVEIPLLGYKLPLVWIDLEMTGLNVEVDRILEIACIITDGKLSKSIEGPDLVINQTQECLDKMGEWCQSHHAASGLTKKVLQSKISEREAENKVLDFLKTNLGTCTVPLLAGNSVYVDLMFLKKYMPELASFFSHVLVDVSSIKALCFRWYPKDHRRAPAKKNNHRAMDDIRESIKELRYYRENIFKAKPKK